MNDLELVVDEAERKGLVFLDDIVDYAILNLPNLAIIKTRSIIKTRVYFILEKKDGNKPSLADMIKSVTI